MRQPVEHRARNPHPRRRSLTGGRANIALFALIALIAVAAVAAIALMSRPATGFEAEFVALVHDGDGQTHELPLDSDAELSVTTSLGTNVVVVQDGAVRVREADCDGLDCVRQGAISSPGRQIICLPHKLWIEVVSPGQQGGVLDIDAAASEEGSLDVLAR